MAPKRSRPTKHTALPNDNAPHLSQQQSSYRQKRARHQDYNTHAFLDASAAVHAGLFGARRLPEIKSLWRSLVRAETEKGAPRAIGGAGRPSAGKVSSRHLRRRTGSHRARRRHRFPRGDLGGVVDEEAGAKSEEKSDHETNTDDGTATSKQSDSKSQEGNINSISKKSQEKQSKPSNKSQRNLPRRARRKPSLLKFTHSTWWHAKQPPTQQPKWIPTHHWHAKRFHVAPLFGWAVPLIHCNRGCRASLRLASEKCTVQDGTWEIDGVALVLVMSSSRDGIAEADDVTEERSVGLQSARGAAIQLMQRICGDASFLKEDAVLEEGKMADGLIYELDAFPMRPIGPATFWIAFSRTGSANEQATIRVSIMVHPSIRQKVQSLLEAIISTCIDDCVAYVSAMPVSLLRIRGAKSMSMMTDVLSVDNRVLIKVDRSNEKTDNTAVGSDELYWRHGSIIDHDASEFSCETGLMALNCQHPTDDDSRSDLEISAANPQKLIIKTHQPNDHLHIKHLFHNTACSGFDILCHPSIASHIFHTFVMKGACAIGFTEDARAHLEACPPMPVFPRDFPDTEEGRMYWEGSSGVSNDVTRGGTWEDWAVVRTCLEAPWGRVNTSLHRVLGHHKKSKCHKDHQDDGKVLNAEPQAQHNTLVTSINEFGRKSSIIRWSSLISSSQDIEQSQPTVVQVRGSFGTPFLQVLDKYGKFLSRISETTKKRKHRRPHRTIIQASPLSKSEREAHSTVCQHILQSLALPAVLRFEIFCDGKGTLDPGDLIFPLTCKTDTDANEEQDLSTVVPLGAVVAGGFSPCRGLCHGVGFIGASKFVEALIHGSEKSAVGVKMPHADDPIMMLKVQLRKLSPDCTDRLAFVTLLL